jgi:excisionase family DNA binding protein
MNTPVASGFKPLEKLLLTCHQAADVLNISEKTLWTLTKKGKVAAIRFEGSVRYTVADLEAFVDRQRVQAEAAQEPEREVEHGDRIDDAI